MHMVCMNRNILIKDKETLSERVTELMVDFYQKCEEKFTVEKAPH